MPASGTIGPVSGGNERIRPAVYGCSDRRKSTSEGADSTISPAYMIAMRSLNSTSSERSCVMKSTAKPSRFLSVSSSCRISRCTTTSSAVVGSSITISSGSSASAIAITTRWRMPPESSCGYERTRPRSIPTISSRSPARASASARRMRSWAWNMSTNWSPTRITGFSTFIALWKTSETCRQRTRRSCCLVIRRGRRRGTGSSRPRPPPAAGGSAARRSRACSCRSPTRRRGPRISPGAIESETSSTARTRRSPSTYSTDRSSMRSSSCGRDGSHQRRFPSSMPASIRRWPAGLRSRGFDTSSRPARMNTSAATVSASARPGKRNVHHSPCSTLELTCAQ